MEIFKQNFTVELSDVTPNFGLKPTTVLRYYQETFARYCAKYHVAGSDVYKIGLKWVFGKSVINFFDVIPIWNEEIITKLYISNAKKLRLYINFEISTKRGLVANGQIVAYILDLNTSRPKPIETIVNHFKLDNDNVNGEIINLNFENQGDLVSEQEHKITFSDIDYNEHTNNISYLSLAFEGMPVEYIKEKYPTTILIKYLQETFLNDTLKCKILKENDNFVYYIKNSKDDSDVCVVNAYWNNKNLSQKEFYNINDTMLCNCSV